MIGITLVNLQRSDDKRKVSTLTLEVTMHDTNAALRKRHEMMAIGLVMMLAAEDPDLANYVMSKVRLDPEKYAAVLTLIDCTKEEVEQDDEEFAKAAGSPPSSGQVLRTTTGTTPQWVTPQARGGPCPKCGSMDTTNASQSLDCNDCGHSW